MMMDVVYLLMGPTPMRGTISTVSFINIHFATRGIGCALRKRPKRFVLLTKGQPTCTSYERDGTKEPLRARPRVHAPDSSLCCYETRQKGCRSAAPADGILAAHCDRNGNSAFPLKRA